MFSQQTSSTESQGVEAYFTDVEELREAFKNAVAAPTLAKRLLMIHGVGGVGKSSLLRMFRLHCRTAGVPAALASADDARSVADVLADWEADLKTGGVALLAFAKTYENYRAIQAKVEEKARKDAGAQALTVAGKAAAKTGEAVGGAVIGGAIGSVIPGLGTAAGVALGSVLGGAGAEALTDWLRGFLKQPDIELYVDPTKRLTEDFLADVAKIAPARRLVFMLDTYEQLAALDDWTREFAQELHPNAQLVIAGREMLNWDRLWPGWLAQARVHALEPMTPDTMRTLVRRYYATQVGGDPDPEQVEKIIRFGRGLPMAVTTAVRLWVKYHQDFEEVEAEALGELVRRLREGVPIATWPVLEAAASVRYFNKEILRAVTGQTDINTAYEELRRFPFVKAGKEGIQPILRLHDSVREFIERSLQVDDPERHRDLHEHAAAFFKAQLAKATGEEAERLGLERLYHFIRSDEEAGIQLFQEMAENLVRFRLVNRLRVLLNNTDTYLLEQENSRRWCDYYAAWILLLETKTAIAESLYEAIIQNEQTEPRLKAYALCDLGWILSRFVRLGQPGAIERAARVLEQSLDLVPLDFHLVDSLSCLAHVCSFQGEWRRGATYLERAARFFEKQGDDYGLLSIYSEMKSIPGFQGNLKEVAKVHRSVLDVLSRVPNLPHLRARYGEWDWIGLMAGRYAEVERQARERLAVMQQLGDAEPAFFALCDLGGALGRQNRFDEARSYLAEATNVVRHIGDQHAKKQSGISMELWGGLLIDQGKFDEARGFLTSSLLIREEVDRFGLPDVLNELARLYAVCEEWNTALGCYRESLRLNTRGRHYHESEAMIGICLAAYRQGSLTDEMSLATRAEQIAQQYEYNDHLASLRLTQGHVAWEGHISEWSGGFDAALRYYQHALIYALRYNRFLLDETLSGRPQGTPLRPIVPHCQERGEEGRRMLITLHNWWLTGVNDIGTPRPDTISPVPEGIPLLEAEQIAREREPGDGTLQKTVIEKIGEALQERMGTAPSNRRTD